MGGFYLSAQHYKGARRWPATRLERIPKQLRDVWYAAALRPIKADTLARTNQQRLTFLVSASVISGGRYNGSCQRPPPTTRDRAPVKMDSDITDLGGRPAAVGSGSATECRQASMRLPAAPVVPEKKTPPTTTTVGVVQCSSN